MQKFSVAVITPTIGRESLVDCIESVKNNIKNYSKIKHYVVFDGVKTNLDLPKYDHVVYTFLPFSSGKNGDYGHKIIASFCSLVSEDYVCFLDDDNLFEENHIESLMLLIETKNLKWAFSFRKFNYKGNIFDDNVESLGPFRRVYNDQLDRLIDTNCYMINRRVALFIPFYWEHKFGSDRHVARVLMKEFPDYGCTHLHTVIYKTDNIFEKSTYKYTQKTIFLFHFTPEQTKNIISLQMKYHDLIIKNGAIEYNPSLSHIQWQLNMFLGSKLVFANGYENWEYAPNDSIFLFNIFNDDQIPTGVFSKNVKKIAYTIESPNIRHQKQWDINFLKQFDIIFTYWEDLFALLELKTKVIKVPFVNKYNFMVKTKKPVLEYQNFVSPFSERTGAGMILENRPFCDQYIINGVRLQSLDFCRIIIAKNINQLINVTCIGDSWSESGLNYISVKNRMLDTKTTVDYLRQFEYAIIIENTNAKGYFSEKVFDAIAAGCIPIYFVNDGCEELINDIKNFSIIIPSSECQNEVYVTELLKRELDEKNISRKKKLLEQDRYTVLKKYSSERLVQAIESVM